MLPTRSIREICLRGISLRMAFVERPVIRRVDEEPTSLAIQSAFDRNSLSRKEDIADFLKMLLMVKPPYTFIVDSPWGTGKTFFVKQIEWILKSLNPAFGANRIELGSQFKNLLKDDDISHFVPLYFNAWENDHFDDPILSLLASFSESIGESCVDTSLNLPLLISEIIHCILAIHNIDIDIKNLSNCFDEKDFLEDYRARTELRQKLNRLISSLIPRVARFAILFIDDLDRCRPEFAIRFLEQTKAIFQLPNVIVVYSTDIVQLSRSLEGVYGSHFAGRAYLERFYDKRIELRRIMPLDYLEFKGLRANRGHPFIDIIGELLDYKNASCRALNRLFDQISSIFEFIYIYIYISPYYSYKDASVFPKFALLPVLIVLSYYEPEQWYEVKCGRSFSFVYDLASHSERFLNQLDSSVIEINESTSNESLISEKSRRAFVEGVCALIYNGKLNDPRVEAVNKGPFLFANTFAVSFSP